MCVESLTLLPGSVLPGRSPVAVDLDGAEVEHSLRTCDAPAHARALHAVAHEVAARSFRDAAADRVAARDVLVVVHEAAVPVHVADRLLESPALALLEVALPELPTEVADHVADFSLAEEPEFPHDPASGVGRALVVEGVGGFPQVGENVPDVEDQHNRAKALEGAFLERLRAIGQHEPGLLLLRVARVE